MSEDSLVLRQHEFQIHVQMHLLQQQQGYRAIFFLGQHHSEQQQLRAQHKGHRGGDLIGQQYVREQ